MKKILSCFAVALLSSGAFAKGNDSNLMFQGGYTRISNYSDNLNYPTLTGWNIGSMYLASFIESSRVHPVVGGGLNYYYTSGKSDYTSGESLNLTLSSLDAVGAGGVKFNLTDNIDLYALFNLNISLVSYMKYEYRGYNLSAGTKIYSAGLYGFSVIPTYNISDDFNIGFGYSFGKRIINVKNDFSNVDKVYTATEQSINLVFGINI